jgi:hypothetical protein
MNEPTVAFARGVCANAAWLGIPGTMPDTVRMYVLCILFKAIFCLPEPEACFIIETVISLLRNAKRCGEGIVVVLVPPLWPIGNLILY